MTARLRPPAAAAMIDLDQYMRAPVRRTNHSPYNTVRAEKLIVDHGRPLDRKPSLSSSSSDVTPRQKYKRYSHDSGLSDGSFRRRKHRTNRRLVPVVVSSENDSLQAFREVCERTLKEQQSQIARVTALCEQLAVKQTGARASSGLSSTTRSSREHRDKHTGSQCKTYKIIMRKLDELNRVFVSRSGAPSPRGRPAPPPYHRAAPPSSESVSVVDKLVATDDLTVAARNMTPRVKTREVAAFSPYKSNIVMESVVQTDFPVPRQASTTFRSRDHPMFHTRQVGGGEAPWGAIWRSLRSYLTLCCPHYT